MHYSVKIISLVNEEATTQASTIWSLKMHAEPVANPASYSFLTLNNDNYIMNILPSKTNTLSFFSVEGYFPAEVKQHVEEMVEEHVKPNNLHLSSGQYGQDYLNSRRRNNVSQLIGCAASLLTSPAVLLATSALKAENPDMPVLYHGSNANPRVKAIDENQESNIEEATTTKLRSMLPGADKLFVPGEKAETACADTITRVGRTLRATKADELPQFWDVAQGRLSIFGTRPMLRKELFGEDITKALRDYKALEDYHNIYNTIPKSPFGFVELVHNQELTSIEDFRRRIASDMIYRTIASKKVDTFMLATIAKKILNKS